MTAISKREQFPLQELDAKKELLKNTIAKGLTDDEFELFCMVCKRTDLDPFMKQIYPVKRSNQMTIQTSIDGFRAIAERTNYYAPGRESTYIYDGKKLVSATSYVKKMTADGTWHEVAATAFFDEYCQVFKGEVGQFWKKMPHVMLAKCAEALALRKAFPALFSKIYTTDEMDQASNDETARSVIEEIPSAECTEIKVEVVKDTLTKEQLDTVRSLLKNDRSLYEEVLSETGKSLFQDVKSKDFELLLDLIEDVKARRKANA